MENQLKGKWVIGPKDRDAVLRFGNVSMEFDDGGRLTYVVHGPKTDQKIFLTYAVKGDVLVTDQPSSPRAC